MNMDIPIVGKNSPRNTQKTQKFPVFGKTSFKRFALLPVKAFNAHEID